MFVGVGNERDRIAALSFCFSRSDGTIEFASAVVLRDDEAPLSSEGFVGKNLPGMLGEHRAVAELPAIEEVAFVSRLGIRKGIVFLAADLSIWNSSFAFKFTAG